MKSIVVFCGSSEGTDKQFKEQATLMGETLALKDIRVIYGGSKAGMMGAVADGALSKGGTVVGVIPGFLKRKEIAHTELSELIVVESMHQRKTIMHELCDGIIALPGGFGTFEELFEVLTWSQLGHHQKPMGLLNVNGYYEDLLEMIQKMVDKGFSNQVNQQMLLVADTVDSLLEKMDNYQAPKVHKWIANDDGL
ncbi:MAG: hypothetical protein ACJAT1_000936 [Marivirga sp.]|jgi:uncharacterized protein (TIGR00730 family)